MENVSQIVSNLIISRNILYFYSTNINLFSYKKVYYINILSISIELIIPNKGNYTLFITKDNYDLQIIIVQPKQLIKNLLKLNYFLSRLRLSYIFDIIYRDSYYRLTFRRKTNSSNIIIKKKTTN